MNNDDMDEAFKKAAEEYELNKEMAANWKGVQEALHHNAPSVAQPVKEKKRRRLIFFWWLLIPAALLIMYGTGMFSSGSKQADINNKQELSGPEPAAANKQKDVANSMKNDTQSKAIRDVNKSANNKRNANETNANQFSKTSANTSNSKDSMTNNNAAKSIKTEVFNNKTAAEERTKSTNDIADNSNRNEALLQQNQAGAATAKSAGIQTNKQAEITNNHTEETTALNEQKNEKSSSITDSTLSSPSKKSKKKSIDNYVRQAYKYAGISTNVDLSFIKDQKTSGIGLGAGIIAGYHFKNGFSIEAGALYDKKNYYTKGAYFSKSRLSDYLQSSEILESEGNCKMWEIPLNIRYDFDTRKTFNWFVTTGISSYLMTKEYYDFTYKYNGDLRRHGYDYKNSSKDWFSVLNLGAGVSIKTGDKYLLQVQPYYKVPLKGVGIGSLSLNSTGLNVNLVRRFK